MEYGYLFRRVFLLLPRSVQVRDGVVGHLGFMSHLGLGLGLTLGVANPNPRARVRVTASYSYICFRVN